jgi:hypothetical protein
VRKEVILNYERKFSKIRWQGTMRLRRKFYRVRLSKFLQGMFQITKNLYLADF